MDGMRSLVLVMSINGKVAGPGSCIETRDGFLDLNTFLKIRFMSTISLTWMIKVNDNDYISGAVPLRPKQQTNVWTIRCDGNCTLKTRPLSYDTGQCQWVGIELSTTVNDAFFRALGEYL